MQVDQAGTHWACTRLDRRHLATPLPAPPGTDPDPLVQVGGFERQMPGAGIGLGQAISQPSRA
ncbi:MAG: hypothetical protein AB1511_11715 [Deinococcota bacterium]